MLKTLEPFVTHSPRIELGPLPPAPFFKKMHSLCNDFVILHHAGPLKSWQVKAFADRRLGVGCDQVLLWAPSEKPDIHAALRIYNADGQEVEACGNGTRCVMWELSQHYGVPSLQVETRAGLVKGYVQGGSDIAVSQGMARFLSEEPLPLGDFGVLEGFAIDIGNPHLVVPVEGAFDQERLCRLGPRLEAHSFFENKTNVEFVKVTPQGVKLFVWERGVGSTKACASGASAAVFALYKEGLLNEPCALVSMEGGDLWVSVDPGGVVSHRADVSLVFQGTFEGLEMYRPETDPVDREDHDDLGTAGLMHPSLSMF